MDQYQDKLFNLNEEVDRGNVGQKGRMVILWTNTSSNCSTFKRNWIKIMRDRKAEW